MTVVEHSKQCMIVTRECESPKGGVSGIRKVCQLIDRCDGHVGM